MFQFHDKFKKQFRKFWLFLNFSVKLSFSNLACQPMKLDHEKITETTDANAFGLCYTGYYCESGLLPWAEFKFGRAS